MKSCVVIYNPNSGHTLKTKHLKEYKIILENTDILQDSLVQNIEAMLKKSLVI